MGAVFNALCRYSIWHLKSYYAIILIKNPVVEYNISQPEGAYNRKIIKIRMMLFKQADEQVHKLLGCATSSSVHYYFAITRLTDRSNSS